MRLIISEKSSNNLIDTLNSLGYEKNSRNENADSGECYGVVNTKKTTDIQEDITADFKDDGLLSVLKNSKYGVAYHDRLITNPSEQDYMNKWHCLSPNEFISVGGGVCYDFVEWEADYLKRHKIPFKKFHISASLIEL